MELLVTGGAGLPGSRCVRAVLSAARGATEPESRRQDPERCEHLRG